MGNNNVLLFGINPLSVIRSFPYPVRFFISFLNFLFGVSLAGLIFYIPFRFIWGVTSLIYDIKLKCPNCNKKDALRLYSYTYIAKHRFYSSGSQAYPDGPVNGGGMETSDPRNSSSRAFIDKCRFCGYEIKSSYFSYEPSEYAILTEYINMSLDEVALDQWRTAHGVYGGFPLKKYSYSENKVHSVQICHICKKEQSGDKCPSCYQCSRCNRNNTNGLDKNGQSKYVVVCEWCGDTNYR
jgi:hypothetical protein